MTRRSSPSTFAAVALALVSLLGCKDDPPPGGPSPAKSAVVGTPAKPSSTASAVASAAASAVTSTAPLGDDAKKKLKAYGAAMERGRKATREKDYKAAATAFGEALTQRPGDVRALSERGYVHDLAGDYAAALKDLRKALGAAHTKEIQAQIWFNIGLAEEGRKDDDAARIAFAKSNDLRPTKAAAEKLEGKTKPVCTAASVDKSYVPGSEYAGWLVAFQGLAARYKTRNPGLPLDEPKSDDDAKALLCKQFGCVGAGPWVVSVGDAVLVELHVVVPVEGDAKKLVAFEEVGEGLGGSCAYVDQVVIKGGDPLQVHVSSADRTVVYMKKGEGGQLEECNKDYDGCEAACMPGEWAERDFFFDVAKKRRVVAVLQSGTGDKKLVDVTRAKNQVVVSGQGCDLKVATNPPI
jgi:Tfp pilus assembly protein PilF